MDVTPGPVPAALTLMLPAAQAPHRSERRPAMLGGWSRSALVALTFVLGLLQGSRAALNDAPQEPAPRPETHAEAPGEASRESDALRGHFYRPAGSRAVRPLLQLRERRWEPNAALRLAEACEASGC